MPTISSASVRLVTQATDTVVLSISSTPKACSRGRHDDVLHLRHVLSGGRGGLVRGAPLLPGVQVCRVPVPPVVRRGDRLERAVAQGSLVQQLGQIRNVHVTPGPADAR